VRAPSAFRFQKPANEIKELHLVRVHDAIQLSLDRSTKMSEEWVERRVEKLSNKVPKTLPCGARNGYFLVEFVL
jgi:hypothetical protein